MTQPSLARHSRRVACFELVACRNGCKYSFRPWPLRDTLRVSRVPLTTHRHGAAGAGRFYWPARRKRRHGVGPFQPPVLLPLHATGHQHPPGTGEPRAPPSTPLRHRSSPATSTLADRTRAANTMVALATDTTPRRRVSHRSTPRGGVAAMSADAATAVAAATAAAAAASEPAVEVPDRPMLLRELGLLMHKMAGVNPQVRRCAPRRGLVIRRRPTNTLRTPSPAGRSGRAGRRR